MHFRKSFSYIKSLSGFGDGAAERFGYASHASDGHSQRVFRMMAAKVKEVAKEMRESAEKAAVAEKLDQGRDECTAEVEA